MTLSLEKAVALTDPVVAGEPPDFFIVGHHKSGTTAMYEMLRRHPQIFMPDMKEPEFFGRGRLASGEVSPSVGGAAKTYAATRPQTYAEYLALFAEAAPGQRTGEASPSYLYSTSAAHEIAAVRPDARIIAILREPAGFLHSLHLQMLRDHVQREPDLRRAIIAEGTMSAGARAPIYTDRIRYVEQLRRYHEIFTSERVLVLVYDDFRADNQGTVRAVLHFLRVDADVPLDEMEVNPTIAARSRRLDDWVRALRTGRGPVTHGVNAAVKAVTPRRMRRDAVRAFQRNVIYGKAPPPDENLMLELRRRFKPEVVALGEYLDRDLVSLWGYDGID